MVSRHAPKEHLQATNEDLAPVAVPPEPINWWGAVPFLALHAGVLLVFWVGVSPIAVAIALATYLGRMFVLTGFYHRYFSHRTFRMTRVPQAFFAFLGTMGLQRGPLWW